MNLTADAIAAAYLDLTGNSTWEPVLISAIRALVSEPREKVDAALLEMASTGSAHLVPDSSRKRNQPAEVEAAIVIGGENKGLLIIEDEYFPG